MQDTQLLHDYITARSQSAFSQLVRQYAGLVYTAARRQVNDAHLAEDVTQAVFLTLAKKAATLPPDVVLSGWLLTATRYAACNARIVAGRRRRHEATAAAIAVRLAGQSHDPRADAWDEIAPALDEAIAELPAVQRDALALRFFDGKSLREVAEALRITEDAAKQRVSRAVRQLRAALGARGVAVSPEGLAGALVAHAADPVPASALHAAVATAARAAHGPGLLKLGAKVPTWFGTAAAATVCVGVLTVLAFAVRSPGPGSGSASSRELVYHVDGMDKVHLRADQAYRKIPQGELWFDAYTPAADAPAGGWPVVLLVHGGPVAITSHPKDWPVYKDYGRLLAASGVAAVTFNYRFTSPTDLPTSESDIAALLAYLRTHAHEMEINPDRVAVWAFSGGGVQLASVFRDRPASVRCVLSFYGALDAPPGMERYSPLAQLKSGNGHVPPTFVARMGRDFPEINRAVDAFVSEARRQQAPIEVADLPEGVHAFDTEQDADASREVIARAVSFAKRHLVVE